MFGPSKNTKQKYIDGTRRWQNSNLRNVLWHEWSSKSLNQMERGLRNMYDYSEVLKLLKKFPSLEKLATPHRSRSRRDRVYKAVLIRELKQ